MLKFGPLSHNMLGNKYLLGELLGVGGFGAVYKAQNVLLDRPQAIKVVTAQAIDDPKGRERFSREARTLANLEHAHIIPVHDFDFDVAKNIVYLVMPYVEGGTLEELLRSRGALPLQEVDFYFEQMCTALDYAHEHDVVHLDLKPANMLLRKDEFLGIRLPALDVQQAITAGSTGGAGMKPLSEETRFRRGGPSSRRSVAIRVIFGTVRF